MKLICKFKFVYETDKIAKCIGESVKLDNKDFVCMKIKKNVIFSEITATETMSLLHTVEDFFSCLSTSEKIVKKCLL